MFTSKWEFPELDYFERGLHPQGKALRDAIFNCKEQEVSRLLSEIDGSEFDLATDAIDCEGLTALQYARDYLWGLKDGAYYNSLIVALIEIQLRKKT